MSDTFRHWLGGLVHASRELALLFAPTVNSYKRFQPDSWAPTAVAWGLDNRTCGLRLVGHGPAYRVESRIPGADVNSYLAFAGVIAAGLHGIENELDPGDAFVGNAYVDPDVEHIPSTLVEAIDLFRELRGGQGRVRRRGPPPPPQLRRAGVARLQPRRHRLGAPPQLRAALASGSRLGRVARHGSCWWHRSDRSLPGAGGGHRRGARRVRPAAAAGAVDMPYGLYVVGSRAGERRNLMTTNWVTQVSFEPKLIGVGIEKPAVTHELIAEGGVFTVNTIAREDRAIVRKFTKPCEWDRGRLDPQRLPVPRRRHRRADPQPGPGLPRLRGAPGRRGRQPHVLHRRGRRRRLPGRRRGHRGPPHGGHPDELRRLTRCARLRRRVVSASAGEHVEQSLRSR